MKQIIELKHHSHDYECMWNGIEDLYMNETGESLPDGFFFLLSDFGSFCYRKTDKSDLKRMVALGDGRTKHMYAFLAPIAGCTYAHHSYSTFERALKKGGRDNATMVLCEIREPEKTWFHKMLDRMHKRDEGDEK